MIYGLQDEYYLSKCQNNQFNHNSKVLPFIEGVYELVDNFNKFVLFLAFPIYYQGKRRYTKDLKNIISSLGERWQD